jgi:hypothetical protein
MEGGEEAPLPLDVWPLYFSVEEGGPGRAPAPPPTHQGRGPTQMEVRRKIESMEG